MDAGETCLERAKIAGIEIIYTPPPFRSATPAISAAGAEPEQKEWSEGGDFDPPGSATLPPGREASVQLRSGCALPAPRWTRQRNPPTTHPVATVPVALPLDRRPLTAQLAGDRPLPKTCFQPTHEAGICHLWSGGDGPRAWRSPSFSQGDCRRFLADAQDHASGKPVTTANGVALQGGMGHIL